MTVTGRVSSDDSYVVIDPAQLKAFITANGGPVMHDLDRRLSNAQAAARRFVGKRTRRLERSIVKRVGVDELGPFGMVVTEGVEYAIPHHNGVPGTRWHGNPFLANAVRFFSQ